MIERARAEQLDAVDPLAQFRERFVVGDPETLYLDGNSLGRLPSATRERIAELVDQWGDQLVTAWDEWIELPVRVGDLLAEAALGARPGEVSSPTPSPSTSTSSRPRCSPSVPARLSLPRDEFPTDRYVLEGLAAATRARAALFEMPIRSTGRASRTWHERAARGRWRSSASRTWTTAPVALAGSRGRSPRRGGAPVLWDLSHAGGRCRSTSTGGRRPGGRLHLQVPERGSRSAGLPVRAGRTFGTGLRQPIQGWFGQREQFAMARAYDPEPGVRGFLTGTPDIPALVAVEEGVRLVAEAGIDRVRAKAEALTTLMVELPDAWLAPVGFELGSPRDPGRRGAHVCLRHAEAWPISRALIERARVIPDFRGPDSIRFGLPPLYTRFVDVHDAADRLRSLVERGEQREVDPAWRRVT